jgi:hypothetical protein
MGSARDGTSSQTPEAASAGLPVLQGLLKSNTLQLPGDQAAAAVSRQQWVSALQLVLLTHAAAAAIAAVVRSPDVLGFWGSSGDNAPLGYRGLPGVGVGLGGVLSLLLVGQTVLRLVSGSCYGKQDGSSGSTGAQSIASKLLLSSRFAGKVLVVELSVAAAVLAAIACMNWALGYAMCFILVPLALTCSVAVPGVASSTESSSQVRVPTAFSLGGPTFLQRAVKAAAFVLCSPLFLLMLVSAWTPVLGIAGSENLGRADLKMLLNLRLHIVDAKWWSMVVWSSSWGTYMVICGLYLPYWLLLFAANTWEHFFVRFCL